MVWLRELWASVRDALFVTAQVVTLGVLALVLGLLALNVLVRQPPARPSPSSQPSRPLVALVPTLVPDTPVPAATTGPAAPSPAAPPPAPSRAPSGPGALSQAPSGPGALTATLTPASPTADAAQAPSGPGAVAATARPADGSAVQPPRAGEASPAPPPAQAPEAAPTARPAEPTPTSAAPAQLMKVLPAADGLPARVRAEPNVRAPILIRVPLGATVEVLGTANGEELQPGNPRWVRIKWRGTTGYVYSALVGNP